MKNKLMAVALLCGLFLSTSCSSDDDGSSTSGPSVTEVVATVSSGTWRVTSYIDSGNDETNDFTGYNFTFGSSNLLVATNGTNTYSGTWSVTDSSSDDDSPSDDVDFNILFLEPANFADLSDDWDIQSRTSTKIVLRDVSGGNGGTDILTFEKN